MKKPILTLGLTGLTVSIQVALLLMSVPAPARATAPIYFTNSNTGYSGWTASGTVDSVATPSIAPNSGRLRGTSSLTRTISIVGYTGISVSWNLPASALESADHCYLELNTGSGCTATGTLNDGQDTSVFFSGTTNNTPGAATNTPTPTNTRTGPTSPPIPGSMVPGDLLTGSGRVARTRSEERRVGKECRL